jgi:hypothetical protein
MHKSVATIALCGVLTAYSGPATAQDDDVEGDAMIWFNTGETGEQTITVNVSVPGDMGDEVLLKVAGDCEYDTKGVPNTNDVVVYGVGHTSATPSDKRGLPGGIPVSVGVACTFSNAYGSLSFDTAAPGPTNVNAAEARITMSPFTMCIRLSAHYQNDSFVRTKWKCRPPILLS